MRLGRYDVHGLIGTGGMGTVYHGLDRELGTPVALKTLNDLAPDLLLRFKNEFRAVADLGDENLVRLYELGREGDLWFFTMERIEGVDFVTALRPDESGVSGASDDEPTRRNVDTSAPTVVGTKATATAREATGTSLPAPPVSADGVRGALRQLARGVQALHSAGLLHLDLKPSNVLIDENGRVVVLDFGLTRAMDLASSPDEEVAGTPAWMAPEQHLGVTVGPPADWYSVGLMLYRTLTGVSAFGSEDFEVLAHAKRNVTPVTPLELVPEVPEDLSELTMALLSPDPEHRPTGREVLAMLKDNPPGPAAGGRRVIVGRSEEESRFAEALRRLHAHGSTALEIAGPSGVGKTALLRLLQNLADEAEALVLESRCYEREAVPYKAFDAMMDALAARLATFDDEELDRLLPEWLVELNHAFPVLGGLPAVKRRLDELGPGTLAPGELRRRVASALCTFLSNLAAERPLVLTIDDVQWIDADSADILTHLLRNRRAGAIVVALGFRPEETATNDAAQRVLGETEEGPFRRERIDVVPLEAAAAQKLASDTLARLGVTDEEMAKLVADESGGVPFFVEELAHLAAAAHRRGDDDVSGRSVGIDAVLTERIGSLDAVERALVDVLAVANSPVPLEVAAQAANVRGKGVLRAVWTLQRTHFVRAFGWERTPSVELHHDRMRECAIALASDDAQARLHHDLAGALDGWCEGDVGNPYYFDMVRHLRAASTRLTEDERIEAARSSLRAATDARRKVAYPLAFELFEAGIELLGTDGWQSQYDLALALHNGAAEAAYLSAKFEAVPKYTEEVIARGESVLDRLPALHAMIDTAIAHKDFDDAVDRGLALLRSLDVELPGHPGPDDVSGAVERTIGVLIEMGPEGFSNLPKTQDPVMIAADVTQTRIGSATYFGRPQLLPIIAANLICSAAERGVTVATPYALSLFGIVLNSIGMYDLAHIWGNVALGLLDLFEDRTLETRTRHCVHDLVCNLLDPLRETLPNAKLVWELGRSTGDLEYAGYGLHAYIHNALYAGLPLEPLYVEAQEASAAMLAFEEYNALHVHRPFEQLIRSFLGLNDDPSRLDGGGFTESEALEAAEAAGSTAAGCLIRIVIGMARYHFGKPAEASAVLEEARSMIEGAPSTWHLPMLHQYSALAKFALDDDELLPAADKDIAALDALAACAPYNFEHRTELLRGERCRRRGMPSEAHNHFEQAILLAEKHGWTNDLALACELAGRLADQRGEDERARELLAAASGSWAAWGAHAKVAALTTAREGELSETLR